MYLRSTSFRHYTMALIVLFLLSVIVIPSTIAQGQNLCRENIPTIEYGDTITAEIDDDLSPFVFYCFEAERGDTVTVIVEPIDAPRANLIPIVLITEPIINSFESMIEDLAENALNGEIALNVLADVEVRAEIDADGTYVVMVGSDQATQGEFDLTLDVEAGQSILGANNIGSDEEEDADSSSSDDEIVLGETNLCSLEEMVFLTNGERFTDDFTPDFPQALFCIEGNEGDIVQIRVGTISGGLIPFVMLGDPFFDGTTDTIFMQDVAGSRSDTAQIIFELPQNGNYFILIGPADNNLGEFYVEFSLVDAESTSFGCENEPLNILSRYPWRISSDADEETSVTFYVTCIGIVLMDVLGADFILEYSFNQDDEFSFIMGDETSANEKVFTTVSVDEDSWVLVNDDDEEEIVLEPFDIASCNDESLSELTYGVWVRDGGDLLAFDFMCDNVVMILIDVQILVDVYVIEDGELIISPDTEQEANLGVVNFEDNTLLLGQDERQILFTNVISSKIGRAHV